MGPYLFFIRHQFNVTLTRRTTHFYCLVWKCTNWYLGLSHVDFVEQSTVYRLKYYNLCIPSVIVLNSSILITI
jgi:hypothetical protein